MFKTKNDNILNNEVQETDDQTNIDKIGHREAVNLLQNIIFIYV